MLQINSQNIIFPRKMLIFKEILGWNLRIKSRLSRVFVFTRLGVATRSRLFPTERPSPDEKIGDSDGTKIYASGIRPFSVG